jgi:hypothetical protein
MFDQRTHIANALAILNTSDTDERPRLLYGGSELWQAMRHEDEWPAGLWAKASAIFAPLLEDGTVRRTVLGMDDAAVSRTLVVLIARLRMLHRDIENAGWQQGEAAVGGILCSTGSLSV